MILKPHSFSFPETPNQLSSSNTTKTAELSNLFFPQSYFQDPNPKLIDHRTQLKRFPNQYSAWQRGLIIGREGVDSCVYDERSPVDEDYMNYLSKKGLGVQQLVTPQEAQRLNYESFEFRPQSNLNVLLGNKYNFLKFCQEAGIDVDDFELYRKSSFSKNSLESILEKFGDSVIIRDVEGSGGKGIYVHRRGENP